MVINDIKCRDAAVVKESLPQTSVSGWNKSTKKRSGYHTRL